MMTVFHRHDLIEYQHPHTAIHCFADPVLIHIP